MIQDTGRETPALPRDSTALARWRAGPCPPMGGIPPACPVLGPIRALRRGFCGVLARVRPLRGPLRGRFLARVAAPRRCLPCRLQNLLTASHGYAIMILPGDAEMHHARSRPFGGRGFAPRPWLRVFYITNRGSVCVTSPGLFRPPRAFFEQNGHLFCSISDIPANALPFTCLSVQKRKQLE